MDGRIPFVPETWGEAQIVLAVAIGVPLLAIMVGMLVGLDTLVLLLLTGLAVVVVLGGGWLGVLLVRHLWR